MAEFMGLERGLFSYFAAPKADRSQDDRQWVRDRIESLAKEVLDRLQKLDASFYQDYDVGWLERQHDYCWVAFGPKEHTYRQLAHQTMSLYAHGLEVFVNVELIGAIKLLRKRINQDRRAFRAVLSRLPLPFTVRLEERQQRHVQVYDYYPIAELEAGCRQVPNEGQYGLTDPKLGGYGFDYIETLLEEIKYPYLSVRRCIGIDLALELSQGNGQPLVDQVVDIMTEFHPLVAFINKIS